MPKKKTGARKKAEKQKDRQKQIRDAHGRRDLAEYPCNFTMVCFETVGCMQFFPFNLKVCTIEAASRLQLNDCAKFSVNLQQLVAVNIAFSSSFGLTLTGSPQRKICSLI